MRKVRDSIPERGLKCEPPVYFVTNLRFLSWKVQAKSSSPLQNVNHRARDAVQL